MTDGARALIRAALARELRRHGPPCSRLGWLRLAARITIEVNGVPASDRAYIEAALALARGFYGDKFVTAAEGARWEWIDLCERCIREAAGKAP